MRKNAELLFLTIAWLSVMGICLFMAVGRLLKVKNSKFLRMILVTACGFLGGMVIYLADWENIVPTFVFFIAAIMICCEGSVIKRLTVGLMTASTVFSFNALVDNWSPFYQTYQIVIKIFFCAGLWLLIRKLGPDRDFELAPSMWRLLFILTLPPLGIVFSLVLLSDYDTAGISVQYLFLLLLSLSAFAGLLWTMVVLARQQKLEEEALLAEQNRRYYEAMENQHFEIRRLKHDMTNHLQTALALPDDQREGYLRELLEHTGIFRTLKYCGDTTVNIILSSKAALMEQNHIEFHVSADISEPLPMEKTDISAIFGNALDNALEAVKNLPENQRRVSLEVRQGKGILAVSVRNPGRLPCAEKTEEKYCRKKNTGILSSLPSTTKNDTKNHGLGLPSIQAALKKYDGMLELRQEGEEVCLLICCYISKSA